MNRRQALRVFASAVATSVVAPPFASSAFAGEPGGPFTLAPLGYPFEALEPHIDAETMKIHHGRHHAAYVTNANKLAEKWPDLAKLPINEVLKALDRAPADVRAGVRNNVGGHWNHNHFWDLMTPGGAKDPSGDVKSGIDGAFGDLETAKKKLNAAAMARFGSGWAWLIVDKAGKFDIVSTANQDTPLELGAKHVLIGVDVWEHAYYLKYQNKRADYLASWWNTVNWDKVAQNLKTAV